MTPRRKATERERPGELLAISARGGWLLFRPLHVVRRGRRPSHLREASGLPIFVQPALLDELGGMNG